MILFFFFFFNDTATTEIYTLSLHDALPIFSLLVNCRYSSCTGMPLMTADENASFLAVKDRKSTRLNSSHQIISYAVFCLKKKKKPIFLTFLNHVTNLCAPDQLDVQERIHDT